MAGYDLALEPGEHRTTARVRGRVDVHGAASLLAELTGAVRARAGDLALDLSGVAYFDSGGAAALALLKRELERDGRALDVVASRPEVDRLLALVDGGAVAQPRDRPPRFPLRERLAASARDLGGRGRDVVAFAGEVALGLLDAVRHPRKVRWRETLVEIQRAGADSLPIVALVGTLIGLITGFQSLIQLRAVGADIYVANLVGLTTTRELGPLMTAVVACGRSGAAYAAEIGTMKVDEEVDALVTLGLDRTRFLVTPKVIAQVLMLPCLGVFADLLGIAGGMFVADLWVDIPPYAYLRQAQWALQPQDFWTGMIKSAAFGLVIAFVGCLRGLQAHGGAESVGQVTTSAVVTSLTMVIVVDAVLTVIFNQYGL